MKTETPIVLKNYRPLLESLVLSISADADLWNKITSRLGATDLTLIAHMLTEASQTDIAKTMKISQGGVSHRIKMILKKINIFRELEMLGIVETDLQFLENHTYINYDRVITYSSICWSFSKTLHQGVTAELLGINQARVSTVLAASKNLAKYHKTARFLEILVQSCGRLNIKNSAGTKDFSYLKHLRAKRVYKSAK